VAAVGGGVERAGGQASLNNAAKAAGNGS